MRKLNIIIIVIITVFFINCPIIKKSFANSTSLYPSTLEGFGKWVSKYLQEKFNGWLDKNYENSPFKLRPEGNMEGNLYREWAKDFFQKKFNNYVEEKNKNTPFKSLPEDIYREFAKDFFSGLFDEFLKEKSIGKELNPINFGNITIDPFSNLLPPAPKRSSINPFSNLLPPAPPGSDIGSSIMPLIENKEEGTVLLENRSGKGTTFNLSNLPSSTRASSLELKQKITTNKGKGSSGPTSSNSSNSSSPGIRLIGYH